MITFNFLKSTEHHLRRICESDKTLATCGDTCTDQYFKIQFTKCMRMEKFMIWSKILEDEKQLLIVRFLILDLYIFYQYFISDMNNDWIDSLLISFRFTVLKILFAFCIFVLDMFGFVYKPALLTWKSSVSSFTHQEALTLFRYFFELFF